jgi:hypothetical protein
MSKEFEESKNFPLEHRLTIQDIILIQGYLEGVKKINEATMAVEKVSPEAEHKVATDIIVNLVYFIMKRVQSESDFDEILGKAKEKIKQMKESPLY